MKLNHLTDRDHAEAARLLREVQDNLGALARIIDRAPFTDRVMRIQKAVQERLIDPLKEMSDIPEKRDSLYPSVYYVIGPVRVRR